MIHAVPAGDASAPHNRVSWETSNDQQGRLALFPLQGNARDSGDPTKPPEGDVRTGEPPSTAVGKEFR